MLLNRRDFSVSAALLGAAGVASTLPAWAQESQLRAGTDYVVLPQPVPLYTPPGKVEVIEFFWYSCPHCAAFEPMFEAWVKKQPDYVIVKRVPIAFQSNNNFVPQQKLYYTLEAMNLVDKYQEAVFTAVHQDRQRLTSDNAVFDWAKRAGIDMDAFKKAYNSFSVANDLRRAVLMQEGFQVNGVPSLGVAGKYYTDGTMARGLANSLRVVDGLVAREHKAHAEG